VNRKAVIEKSRQLFSFINSSVLPDFLLPAKKSCDLFHHFPSLINVEAKRRIAAQRAFLLNQKVCSPRTHILVQQAQPTLVSGSVIHELDSTRGFI